MRLSPTTIARSSLLALAILACTADGVTGPGTTGPGTTSTAAPAANAGPSSGGIVISQVYGGGGNSGATYKNDFIELYNAGSAPVSVSGWSVQYASSGGAFTNGNKTKLSGTIQPGGYYLIQEAQGNNGTVSLDRPDAIGAIAMSGTSGKVALVRDTLVLTTGCPLTVASVVDFVGYGASANCSEGSRPTADLSNTTAAIRKNSGRQDTGVNADDFGTGAPIPRGTNTVISEPATVSVRVSYVVMGSPFTLSATALDKNGKPTTTTYTWTSANPDIATIGAETGIATGVRPGIATVTATSANGIVGSAPLFVVNPGDVASVSLSINDPAQVPEGYTKPAFATTKTTSGATVTPELSWTSSDPSVATVSSLGYITGVAAGKATIRATAPDGVYGEVPFTVIPAAAPTTAIYRDHLAFGAPTGVPAGEIVLSKRQYVAGYNPQRGGPDWVSWNINASQFGAAPRCDCFSADQTLPGDVYHVVDFDYRNGGYDRGHMVQSESRTASDQENASTFLLTNILPQGAENNQGPWSKFENYLNDLARTNGKEIYVVAGGEYAAEPATLKGEGKVAIPDYTWKVAVVLDGGRGLADVHSPSDLEVIAIKMPNLTTAGGPASSVGIRNNPWEQYRVTVSQIERETGYDLLSRLPDDVECRVESRNCAPVARITGSGVAGGSEGQTLTFDAATSSDADGDALSYAWSLDGEPAGTESTLSHVFPDNGSHALQLVVSDGQGAADTVTLTVAVANVAPVVGGFPGATLLRGETYAASGTFTDPGADQWSGTASYGDGAAPAALTLTEKRFELQHAYTAAGTFTVTVTVTDDDAAAGTSSATVTVLSPLQGVGELNDALARLDLERGELTSLRAKLNAASAQLRRDDAAGVEMLNGFVGELQALVQSGRLAEGTAAPIVEYAQRVIRSAQR